MKSFAVTIGIPAYNEEANISFLLEGILRQDRHSYEVKEILVVSDGSTDETANIAKRYEASGVTVFDDGKRKGKAARVNEIFRSAHPESGAIILLDADILLSGSDVFERLVSAVRKGNDLASPSLVAVPARTFFGRAIVVSHELKRLTFAEWKSGQNVYSCHGAARIFSRRFFSALNFVESVGEDAYSYFSAKSHGFRYAFLPSASVAIRVPESFADHRKQSFRYASSRSMFEKEFGVEMIRSEYAYPKIILARNFLNLFLRHSLLLSVYVFAMIRLRLSRVPKASSLWEAASSSKRVN